MLLTITYTGKKTQEMGFLLHKNPYHAQSFDLSFGKAYVFYPEVSDERTTAALLLDIDPIDLARGKSGTNEGGLFDYVNDRPYGISVSTGRLPERSTSTAFPCGSTGRPTIAAMLPSFTGTFRSLRFRP